MVEADPVMRAARNGFGVVMVLLLLAWVYTFAFTESANQRLFDVWLVGAAVYWVSQWYYRRQRQTPISVDDEASFEND